MDPFIESTDKAFPPASTGLLRTQITFVAAALVILLLVAQLPLNSISIPLKSYVPIHTTLEFVSILVAFLIFATVWNTPNEQASKSSLFIAISLMACGVLDFLHALSIPGMPDLVTVCSSQKSIAFWLAARIIFTSTIMWGSLYPQLPPDTRETYRYRIAIFYVGIIAVVFYAVLFVPEKIPEFFVSDIGVTRTKTYLEIALSITLACACWNYYKNAKMNSDAVNALMFSATAIATFSEIFFIDYRVGNDATNLFGHIYKIIAYWLIYRALFVLSVKRPYEILSSQNEQLRHQSIALENAASNIFLTDLQGKIVWKNRSSKLLRDKFPRTERDVELFDPRMFPDPERMKAMRKTLNAGKSWHGIVEYKEISGKELYIDRIISPIKSESGQVKGYVSIGDDVTSNIHSKRQHQRILETAIDGFLIANLDGEIKESNPSYCKMCGYSEDELVHMKISDLKFPEESDFFDDKMKLIREHRQLRFDSTQRKKDGSILLLEVSVTIDIAAELMYIFARDKTEKEASRLKQLELERQLQHSQKVQALGQLTSGIAHDFNNILASILGYSNLALSRFVPDKDSKLAKYLNEIITSSERARDLIAKMLVFTRSQPEAAKLIINPSDIINEAIEMLRPSIPSSIKIEFNCKTDKQIRINPGELHQIIVNLVINARDALPGHGRITIDLNTEDTAGLMCSFSQKSLAGEYLSINICDNGSGIDPQTLARIFDPYFTTKDVGKGSGLGLAMVQGILQRSNSHLVVSSQLGMGSSFRLLFPIESQVKNAHSNGEIKSLPTDGMGRTIWIVDDEASISTYLAELLESNGYKVCTFNSPIVALDSFLTAGRSFSLLITDQTMPDMLGSEMASKMRKTRPDLPILFCTGLTSDLITPTGNRTRVLKKPMQADEVLNAVAQLL